MRKVFVNANNCSPGMEVADAIYNEFGAVIVAENTILDIHLIKKLLNLDIDRVAIYEQASNIINSNSSELFNAQYKENVNIVKDILHDISIGKNIDLKKANTLSESIVVRINENRDIIGCINQIKSVDEYTYTHSVNVAMICMLIGKWMRYSVGEIRLLIQAGLFHDIGKGKIAPEILNKPGALTEEEIEEIKKHPVYGFRILEKLGNINPDVQKAVLMHHEREDGSGYPVGLKGDQIIDLAKIIAVADIYDAMTSDRVYHSKESPFDVFELMETKVFGILNHRVVNAFLNNIAAYYVGDNVKLSNGETGEIVYINPRCASRPVIRTGNNYIDMAENTELRISQLL